MAGLADLLGGIDPSVLASVGSALLSAPPGERLGRSVGRATAVGLQANESQKDRKARVEEQEYLKTLRQFQMQRAKEDAQREAQKQAWLSSLLGLGAGGGAMGPSGPMATGQFGMKDILGGMQAGFSTGEMGGLAQLAAGPGQPKPPGSMGGILAQDLNQRIASAGTPEERAALMDEAKDLYLRADPMGIKSMMSLLGGGGGEAGPAQAPGVVPGQPPPAAEGPGILDSIGKFLGLGGGDPAAVPDPGGATPNAVSPLVLNIAHATNDRELRRAVAEAQAAGIPQEQIDAAIAQRGP